VNKAWYRREPELYKEIWKAVQDTYPELSFIERDSDVLVAGYYVLFEGSQVYDRYLIEVEMPTESPKGLPIVREIGGRIPRESDRHMEAAGKACIVLPDAFWYEHPKGMSLLDFLDGPVRGFFAGQSLIELGIKDPWPVGQWGHVHVGIIDFYSGVFGTKDPEVICRYLNLLKRGTIKTRRPCPCGSGIMLQKCHLELINALRSRIPRDVAAKSEEGLLKFLAINRAASKIKGDN